MQSASPKRRGEKTAPRSVSQGDGAKSRWNEDYLKAAQALDGRDVALLEDYDDPGAGHMDAATRHLLPITPSLKRPYIQILDTGEGQDISDYFDRGGRWDWLEALIAETPVITEPRAEPNPGSSDGAGSGPAEEPPIDAWRAMRVNRAKRRALIMKERNRTRRAGGCEHCSCLVTDQGTFQGHKGDLGTLGCTLRTEDMSKAMPPAERKHLASRAFGEDVADYRYGGTKSQPAVCGGERLRAVQGLRVKRPRPVGPAAQGQVHHLQT